MVKLFYTTKHKIGKKKFTLFVENLFQKYDIPPEYQVNIIFVGKRKMKEIATLYKGEPVALPVLTFSYKNDEAHTEEKLFGEIFICFPQAVLLAAQKDKSVDYVLFELIEHGINNLTNS